jgi:hypothetical protein
VEKRDRIANARELESLDWWRRKQGMTLDEAAARIGKTGSTLNRALNQQPRIRPLRLSDLRKIRGEQ